jgi:hypothetical protein
MDTIASLIRQFPDGSFIIILAIIGGITTVARAFVNRNKPVCDCECCNLDDEDDDIEGGEDDES